MTNLFLPRFLCSLLLVPIALPSAAAAKCSDDTVRVMTYNIRLDTANDGENRWANRRRWMAEQIRWLAPQIFGLQEVVPGQKQDFVKDFPDYQVIGAGRDDGKEKGEASPIAFARSNFTLQASGTFWLSATPDKPGKGWDAAYPRVASWVRLRSKCGAGKLLVVNTHWDHIGVEARNQSGRQLAGWIANNRKAGERLLLMGDFNIGIDSEAMRALTDGGLLLDSRAISATASFGPEGSFNAFQLQPAATSAIDHILVGEQWAVERHAVIAQNVNGRMISDHYPVLADLHPIPTGKDGNLRPQPGKQIAIQPKATAYPYLLFTPAKRKDRYPLLIFLHGSGERGGAIDRVKVHGPPKFAETREGFPFVAVSPHLEEGGKWDNARLDAMLADVRKRVPVDSKRIYLTGLSLGGHGTWLWAAARPGTFAAIAPISGRGDPATACALANKPMWAFHGEQDSIVPPSGSSTMIEAVRNCPGNIPSLSSLTLYPDLGHDAWTRTYDDPVLYDWMLANKLGQVKR